MPFFYDGRTPYNPNLCPKPKLCPGCKKNNDPEVEILCTLNRADHQDKPEFKCGAHEGLTDAPGITNEG